MVKQLKSKLTKPKAPESIDALLAAGARLVFNVPVTDEKGRVLSQEEVKELHRGSALTQIASHEKIVAKADGLRPLEAIEPELASRQAETGRASAHWQLMQRRYYGGMAEMPDVAEAQRAFNVAAEASRAVVREYSLVKAAVEARAEIERLRKEFNV
ncbi:hypothetical protein [Paraburkholderia phenoliruptrix]|uniref:hypothetical protein n=1 Tax=Paraburkholderia phenoliruptrix TaxID=252970 RepID=UPI002869EB9D|nr:hypothetical protein [Paraburkholderia phenoliruptrix]WMY06770.1 hypothetical protein P3F88_10710 [Paraburkholderia phenoliruptrix]